MGCPSLRKQSGVHQSVGQVSARAKSLPLDTAKPGQAQAKRMWSVAVDAAGSPSQRAIGGAANRWADPSDTALPSWRAIVALATALNPAKRAIAESLGRQLVSLAGERDAPRSGVCVKDTTLDAVATVGELAGTLRKALADNEIDHKERAELLALSSQLRRLLGVFEAGVSR